MQLIEITYKIENLVYSTIKLYIPLHRSGTLLNYLTPLLNHT